jgi:non-heme chloroperoxidase
MMRFKRAQNSMFSKASRAALSAALSIALTSYALQGSGGTRAAASGDTSQQAGLGIRVNAIMTSDGAQIRYLQAGQASPASAIVFIPGWTLSASLWDHELRTFSADRLAIAVESRSQGGSTKMVTGNTPERRAIDLHEIVDNLHISKFVIVGWSQGAQDVAAYIQQFGTDSLAGVVFVDSPVSAGPAEIDIHKEFSKFLLSRLSSYAEHPNEYSEGLVRSIFSKPHPELDMQHLIEESEKTPTSIGTAMLVMDIFGVDRRPALKKINRPTLVIASSTSPLLDAQKEMVGEIPGARLVVVEDAGHAVFIDQPEKFDDAVLQLLQTAGH